MTTKARPRPLPPRPSMKTLEKMVDTGIAKCVDGCKVEPDCAACTHGSPNWLFVLGIM